MSSQTAAPAAPQQQQSAPSAQAAQAGAAAATPAAAGGAAGSGGAPASACPPHVLEAIYGKQKDKKATYEASLQRWWTEYADRKNDETEEYVSNSLLYDRRHLPRTAPAPDCVRVAQQQQAATQAQQQQQPAAP